MIKEVCDINKREGVRKWKSGVSDISHLYLGHGGNKGESITWKRHGLYPICKELKKKAHFEHLNIV